MTRAVAALREHRTPTPEASARVWASLGPIIGPGGGGGTSLSGGSGVTASWVAKVIGATAAMTAGGLALVRAGALALGLSTPAEPASPPKAGTEVVLDLAPAPSEEIRPLDAPPSDPPAPAKLLEPKPAAAADLEAELVLIAEARKQSDPAEALDQLDRHAREFPRGALASERDALRVVSLCRLDRLAQARTSARALLHSRPASPLIDRMRDACPELADEFD